MKTTHVLKTCSASMKSYGGFEYPTEGYVEAPDWDGLKNEYGGGLYGLLKGEGIPSRMSNDKNAIWLVIEVDEDKIINLGTMVKFPSGNVIYAGERSIAIALMKKLHPEANVVCQNIRLKSGEWVDAPEKSKIKAADGCKIKINGMGGEIIAGDACKITSEFGCKIIVGDTCNIDTNGYDEISGENYITIQTGNNGQIKVKNNALIKAGGHVSIEALDNASIEADDFCNIKTTKHAKVIAKYASNIEVDDYSEAIVSGKFGKILAGNKCKVVVGDVGRATAFNESDITVGKSGFVTLVGNKGKITLGVDSVAFHVDVPEGNSWTYNEFAVLGLQLLLNEL